MKSILNFLKYPYNRKSIFSIFRLIEWKLIRVLKLKGIKKTFWDREFNISYDSLQCMWLYYHYIVDWEEFNLIRDISKVDDVVFDVGANMGFYGLWMSKFVSNGSIHVFEPSKDTFVRCANNYNLNSKKINAEIILNELAIGDHVGFAYLSGDKDGENHLTTDTMITGNKISLDTIDNYVIDRNIKKINYCKIDIEGFELHALRGAENMLRGKNIDCIQIEINRALENSGVSVRELLEFIENVDYQLCCYNVDERKLEKIDYISERENYFLVSDLSSINQKIHNQG